MGAFHISTETVEKSAVWFFWTWRKASWSIISCLPWRCLDSYASALTASFLQKFQNWLHSFNLGISLISLIYSSERKRTYCYEILLLLGAFHLSKPWKNVQLDFSEPDAKLSELLLSLFLLWSDALPASLQLHNHQDRGIVLMSKIIIVSYFLWAKSSS